MTAGQSITTPVTSVERDSDKQLSRISSVRYPDKHISFDIPSDSEEAHFFDGLQPMAYLAAAYGFVPVAFRPREYSNLG